MLPFYTFSAIMMKTGLKGEFVLMEEYTSLKA